MRLTLDQDLEKIIQSAGQKNVVNELTFRRSASAPLILSFAQSGAIVDPGALEINFVLKSEGKYDQDPPLLLNGSWTKSGSGSDASWEASLNFITTTLDALFVVDGDDTNDEPSISVMGEIVWTVDGVTRRTGRITVNIDNNIYRGTETPAEETAAPGTYLTAAGNNRLRPQLAITTHSELRAYVTDGVPRPHLIAVNIPGAARLWLVQDGTGADNADWRIRPDDYVDTSNEVEIVSYL
ncbi:hypothetical protein QEH52_01820 [Coraliomargarita sp. SDUM461003]|uniref:Uncharacterized protein n=1 Tax=Thalassobacterium maritimum TaxID=3041265 RepID=A0ABU1AQ12_9BACT|nr:hypothetical protein [Coraliomargarita sp. SDUM461003]MDQ8206230.1 hypothetical protein [Coraliomargarita sp. SDUM461003]